MTAADRDKQAIESASSSKGLCRALVVGLTVAQSATRRVAEFNRIVADSKQDGLSPEVSTILRRVESDLKEAIEAALQTESEFSADLKGAIETLANSPDIWTDPDADERGHSLLTPEIAEATPSMDEINEIGLDEVRRRIPAATYHSASIGWKWHMAGLDPRTGACFGLVEGAVAEWGYFELDELTIGGPNYVRRIEPPTEKTFGQIEEDAQG